jgi:endonuclease/exonuclease/phosphatase family metal-dependent hydrolase
MRALATILVFLFSPVYFIFAQQETADNINILFYNTENLFDTADDPETLDDEFLPGGERHWTNFRLYKKLNQLSKLILAASGFEPPEIIGLCEVENRFVLEKLLDATPLKSSAYSIIHKNSPDERGIDVALLYRDNRVKPLSYGYIPVLNEKQEQQQTREILYAEFLLPGEDTVHVFFNHWPSRYGGQTETEVFRYQAANALKQATEKVQQKSPSAKIVIMGDFNDEPKNRSLKEVLQAVEYETFKNGNELVNLSYNWKQGTIKFRQTWSVFDQIIVSGNLLNPRGRHTSPNLAKVVALPFLFEDDPKFKGKRLNRTYIGFKYNGGFSDHLPLLLKLEK